MPLDKYKNQPKGTLYTAKPAKGFLDNFARSQKKSARIFMLIFGVVFFGTGSWIVWTKGVQGLMIQKAAIHWPRVKAYIQHSDVSSRSDSDSTQYSFDVRYSYIYEGKAYTSSRYSANYMSSPDSSHAYRLKDIYGVGSQMTAYVNPDDPYYALLTIKNGWEDYFPFVFLLFNVFGLFAIIGAFRLPDSMINNSN